MSKRTKKVPVRKILRERARQQRQADDVVPPAPPRKQLKKSAGGQPRGSALIQPKTARKLLEPCQVMERDNGPQRTAKVAFRRDCTITVH